MMTALLSFLLVFSALLTAKAASEAAKDAKREDASGNARPHVCIIGAGIAGASTAHFLSESAPARVRITIYEKETRIGGRIASVPISVDKDDTAIEAGASIIAERNRLMAHFVALLNLTRRTPDSSIELALWDGKAFRLRMSRHPSITATRMLTRYRMSVIRMRNLVGGLLKRFDALYPSTWTLRALSAASDIQTLLKPTQELFALTQSHFKALTKATLSARFIDEIVAAITRCNYNQEPSTMSALAGAVAMAGSGGALWGVQGGNERVVSGLISRSGAQVNLGSRVSHIEHAPGGGYMLTTTYGGDVCDAVVIATPLELTDLVIPEELAAHVDIGRKFQRTVATFVRGVLSKETFGSDAPQAVLTTAHGEADFSSVSRVHRFANGSMLFKVFSSAVLGQRELARIFEEGAVVVAAYPWLAYPKYAAPERFAPFDVDAGGAMCYTSAIESAASAMEMSALAGANCAAVVWEKLGLPLVHAPVGGDVAGGGAPSRDEL